MMQELKDKTLYELEQLVVRFGQKKYVAGYIFSFIHQKRVTDILQISPLSKFFRAKLLEAGCSICELVKIRTFHDPDGTIKYLFELPDGNRIEAVVLIDDGRKTLCLSTQAGCTMNCVFCATAKLEFRRNLTAAEIISQVNTVENDNHKINNVVYMGMGEPLDNYDAVVRSVQILNHPKAENIGVRHLTVSTCGISPAIEKLASEPVHPRLAVSLNAPTDTLRTRLMPMNKEYPIASVIKAVRTYQQKTKRRVTFEYVLIKDVNDKISHAQMLTKLFTGLKFNVNLIEYNPHPGCKFVPSEKDVIKRFAHILDAVGIETVIRYKRGQKIKAACGQLGADWLNLANVPKNG